MPYGPSGVQPDAPPAPSWTARCTVPYRIPATSATVPPYGLAENIVATCSTALSFNTTVLSPKKRGRNIHGGGMVPLHLPTRVRQAAAPPAPAAHTGFRFSSALSARPGAPCPGSAYAYAPGAPWCLRWPAWHMPWTPRRRRSKRLFPVRPTAISTQSGMERIAGSKDEQARFSGLRGRQSRTFRPFPNVRGYRVVTARERGIIVGDMSAMIFSGIELER